MANQCKMFLIQVIVLICMILLLNPLIKMLPMLQGSLPLCWTISTVTYQNPE